MQGKMLWETGIGQKTTTIPPALQTAVKTGTVLKHLPPGQQPQGTGMKKKHVFLHIGYDKTGTSAIQQFLFQNREILAGQGILYPESAMPYKEYRNHTALVLAMRRTVKFEEDEGMVLDRFREIDRKRILPELLWKNLTGEIDASPCPKVCISSEAFVNFAKNDDSAVLIGETAEHLRRYDVSVIVYIRQQDDYLESFYNQIVKKGRTVWGYPNHFWRNLNPLRGDYMQALDAWSDVFGTDRMIVRKYSKKEFGPGGIVPDFLRLLGADGDATWNRPARNRANPRLPNRMVELKRRSNRLRRYFRLHRSLLFNELINRAIYRMARKRKPSGRVRLLSPEQRRDILRHYESVNARIAEDYFPGEGPLFSPAEIDEGDPWIEPRLRMRDAAELVPALAVVSWKYFHRRVLRRGRTPRK